MRLNSIKTMKKIILLLGIASLVFSCSSDDSSDGGGVSSSVSTTDLVGTWVLTSESLNGELLMLDACELETNVVFTDSRYTKTESNTVGGVCNSNIEAAGVYQIDGDELYLDQQFSDGQIEGVYEGDISVSGDTLVISDLYVDANGIDSGEVWTYTKVSDDSQIITNPETEESVIMKEDLIGNWVLISSETDGISVVDDLGCDLQDNLTFTQDQFITEDFYDLGVDCFSFDPKVYEYIIEDDELRIVEGNDGIISSLWGNIALENNQLIVTVLLFDDLINVRIYEKN